MARHTTGAPSPNYGHCKASECKLESPKEDVPNKAEDEHKLQLKQALMAMEEDNESIE